jgi:hypothetical protein
MSGRPECPGRQTRFFRDDLVVQVQMAAHGLIERGAMVVMVASLPGGPLGLGVGGTASRIDGRRVVRGTWLADAPGRKEARSICRSGFMAPWLTFGLSERGRHQPRLNLPLKSAKLAPSLAV